MGRASAFRVLESLPRAYGPLTIIIEENGSEHMINKTHLLAP